MGRVALYLVAAATAMTVGTAYAQAPTPGPSGYYIRDYAEINSVAATGQPWWTMTFDLIVKLGLVIGLIYLTTWALRTYVVGSRARGPLGLGGVKKIDVLEATNLAPNRTLYLVEVADRVLVLGATPSGMNTLSEIRDPDAIQLLKAKVPEEPVAPGFAEQLKAVAAHLPQGTASGQFLGDKIGELRALATQFRRTPVEADRAEA